MAYHEYIRKDGSKSVFENESDYKVFTNLINSSAIDIDEQIDQWIKVMLMDLKNKSFTEEESKLFFNRFKMAI